MINGAYRRDIDGLRGVAILLVIAFHAFPNALPAGFIGVDIFFVISGFLITQIIVRQQQAQSFSLKAFYRRRILRLLPALLCVLVVFNLLGWYFLLPNEFLALNKHTASSALFLNNFLLLSESGYFDTQSHTKPLLHLWSLGIEEQFYLIWPLLLILLLKRGGLLVGTIVLAALSLSLCLLLQPTHPNATFYLPISRFWQLLAGAIIAIYPISHNRYPNLYNILALILLASALSIISQDSGYPDWKAMLPTVACAMLLISPSGFINKQLSKAFWVYTGKISYSLYLWHWPFLSFSYILFDKTPHPYVIYIALILSLICAIGCYRLIEKPARYSKQKIATPLLLALMGLSAVSAVNYHDAIIFPKRAALADKSTPEGRFYIKAQREPDFLIRQLDGRDEIIDLQHCEFEKQPDKPLMTLKDSDPCLQIPEGKPFAIILGDSFASDTYGAMLQSFPNTHLIRIPYSRCQFSASFYIDTDSDCSQYLRSLDKANIIIAMQWSGYHADMQPDITAMSNDQHPVVVIGPGIEFHDWFYNIMARRQASESMQSLVERHLKQDRFSLNQAMAEHFRAHGISYIDRIALFCDTLPNCELFEADGTPFIVDWGHLFPAGMRYFGEQLAKHPRLLHLHE